jgi:ribose 5-phosphate isomerase A
MRAMESLGGRPSLRIGERKDGPVVSDQGFWIVDVSFDGIDDPAAMDRAIRSVPGVLDHGLFIGLATDVLVGRADGSVEHRTRGRVA